MLESMSDRLKKLERVRWAAQIIRKLVNPGPQRRDSLTAESEMSDVTLASSESQRAEKKQTSESTLSSKEALIFTVCKEAINRDNDDVYRSTAISNIKDRMVEIVQSENGAKKADEVCRRLMQQIVNNPMRIVAYKEVVRSIAAGCGAAGDLPDSLNDLKALVGISR